MATRNPLPQPEYKAGTARDAYEALKPELARLLPEQIIELRSDLEIAVLGVLGVINYLEAHQFEAALADLPEKYFKRRSIKDLTQACWAGWYLQSEVEVLQKQSKVKVPKDLWEQASALENKLQECCEYNLRRVPEAKLRLDQLRPGTGHIDTAKDLLGYAALYEQYPDIFKNDKQLYDPNDIPLAKELAHQLLALVVGEKGTNLAELLDHRHRVWTLIFKLYENQVAATARWYYREDPDAADLFPGIRSFRRPAEPKKKGQEE